MQVKVRQFQIYALVGANVNGVDGTEYGPYMPSNNFTVNTNGAPQTIKPEYISKRIGARAYLIGDGLGGFPLLSGPISYRSNNSNYLNDGDTFFISGSFSFQRHGAGTGTNSLFIQIIADNFYSTIIPTPEMLNNEPIVYRTNLRVDVEGATASVVRIGA